MNIDWQNVRVAFFGSILAIALWERFARKPVARAWAEARSVANIARIRAQHRNAYKRLERERATLKGKVLSVGDLQHLPDGVRLIGDWQFDCTNGALPSHVDAKGNCFYCGYSVKELIEIHARRDEYVTRGRHD